MFDKTGSVLLAGTAWLTIEIPRFKFSCKQESFIAALRSSS
jgi:hypothetical protein